MFKKIITVFLTAMIFTVASGINTFAQTNKIDENQTVAKQGAKTDSADLKSLVKARTGSNEVKISNKSTLADYQKAKQQSSKFSTTTKVLIGVGIAVAVVGVIFVVARRDLKSNILR